LTSMQCDIPREIRRGTARWISRADGSVTSRKFESFIRALPARHGVRKMRQCPKSRSCVRLQYPSLFSRPNHRPVIPFCIRVRNRQSSIPVTVHADANLSLPIALSMTLADHEILALGTFGGGRAGLFLRPIVRQFTQKDEYRTEGPAMFWRSRCVDPHHGPSP
jgi:hypothetical protein